MPLFHITNPPKIEREAEPLPRLAIMDFNLVSEVLPTRPANASANADALAAEPASPLPTGNYFFVVTSSFSLNPVYLLIALR